MLAPHTEAASLFTIQANLSSFEDSADEIAVACLSGVIIASANQPALPQAKRMLGRPSLVSHQRRMQSLLDILTQPAGSKSMYLPSRHSLMQVEVQRLSQLTGDSGGRQILHLELMSDLGFRLSLRPFVINEVCKARSHELRFLQSDLVESVDKGCSLLDNRVMEIATRANGS
jgi:hypothetical protein